MSVNHTIGVSRKGGICYQSILLRIFSRTVLSLRLMHGEEAHLLLALEDDERTSLLAFARAVSAARNAEKLT